MYRYNGSPEGCPESVRDSFGVLIVFNLGSYRAQIIISEYNDMFFRFSSPADSNFNHQPWRKVTSSDVAGTEPVE